MSPRRGKPARRYEPSQARARAIRHARERAQMSERDLASGGRVPGDRQGMGGCRAGPGPGHGVADRGGCESACLVAADAVRG